MNKVEVKNYIVQHYANTMTAEIMAVTGLSRAAIYRVAQRNDLKKDRAIIVATARERTSDPNHPAQKSMFRKGNVSFNKGLRQADFMSAEAIERTKATRFQKGIRVHNTKEDGEVTLRLDGYYYIRVALNDWKLYSRWLWEKHHGAIPEGMLVMFLDKNSQNCVLENLCLQTMQDCMKQNNIHQLPEDLKGAIYALNGFKRRLQTKIKKNGKEQN